jgi:hypothetical protein
MVMMSQGMGAAGLRDSGSSKKRKSKKKKKRSEAAGAAAGDGTDPYTEEGQEQWYEGQEAQAHTADSEWGGEAYEGWGNDPISTEEAEL